MIVPYPFFLLMDKVEPRETVRKVSDALLEAYAGMAPEALASLTPEEHHRVYEMLKLRVVAQLDGTLEVNGALAENLGVSNLETTPGHPLLQRQRAHLQHPARLRVYRLYLPPTEQRRLQSGRGKILERPASTHPGLS